MSKPLLLDLFCGVGGAAMGYHRAGFDLVGVDNKPQPRYPFEFILADAMTFPLDGFDVIHASPPCQIHSALNAIYCHDKRRSPDLVAATRERLQKMSMPWVIENVPGAPLATTFMLCGSMFGLRQNGAYLRRHRIFESNILILTPSCTHEGQAIGVFGHGEHFRLNGTRMSLPADEAREIMGMPWASRDGVSQAIPPAYTEYIGRQLINVLKAPTVL